MGDIVFKVKRPKLDKVVQSISQELDDHLDAINANTHEIVENRAMILELEERLNLIKDEIATLRLAIDEINSVRPKIQLNLLEQELFLVLYYEETGISYSELSRKLGVPICKVRELTFSLISKGVPVLKIRRGNEIFCCLDIEFKEEHSKQPIVVIDNTSRINKFKQTSLL